MSIEVVHRLIRRYVGSTSVVYRTASNLANFISVSRKEGIVFYRSLMKLKRGGWGVEQKMWLKFSNLEFPIAVRAGSNDASVLINNVVREEYGHFSPGVKPKWMIDAGAYIVDTTAYFLSRFPELFVVALEPNPSSYEVAMANLAPYGKRAQLLKKGLWGCVETQHFGGKFTGASVREEGLQIECIDIPFILDRYSIPYLDILKMDIEGAEESVFNCNPTFWLSRVKMIIIEFHGEHRKKMILDVLKKNNFTFQQYRSLWYCMRSGATCEGSKQ
jgi:FkbM family methyltransferase